MSSSGECRAGCEFREPPEKLPELYLPRLDEIRALGGIIDYTVGTLGAKVYVLAEHDDPKQRHYLDLYKMGPGPLYAFWVPYHLVHFEVPNAIARVRIFRDELAPPLAGPVVEVCAVAKRDLEVRRDARRVRSLHDVRRSGELRRDAARVSTCPKGWSRAASCAATSRATR